MMSTQTGSDVEQQARLADLAEEATGFGATEFRSARDLLLRPKQVLHAYLDHGPTGGRRYARPMGFYFALCGVLMFYLFLLGGMKGIIAQQPAAMIDPWLAASGKSRDSFFNDVDGWLSLVSVPLMSVVYALFSAPLLKWWGGLDWRRSLRATFALLCAWTVPMLPLGPLPYLDGLQLIGSLLINLLFVAAFLRMGRGLWFAGWPGGVAKAIGLLAVITVAGFVGITLSMLLSLAGASMSG